MYASFNVTCIPLARVVLLNSICNTVCHTAISERKTRWRNEILLFFSFILDDVLLECIASVYDLRLYIHVYSCT